jgi:hypothetical protein
MLPRTDTGVGLMYIKTRTLYKVVPFFSEFTKTIVYPKGGLP